MIVKGNRQRHPITIQVEFLIFIVSKYALLNNLNITFILLMIDYIE
jgi:hypothetical protein